MITKRFFISGIVTTAAVASASTFIPAVAPQLYATVYGVGWDLEVIEHHIYEPMSVAYFGGTPDIDKFREVTAFVHAFPVEPMPININRNFRTDPIDPLDRFRVPKCEDGLPFDPIGFTPSSIYRLAEDMGPSAQVGIWDPGRAAKEDEKPHWAKYDYVTHSRKLGRDEA